MIKIKKNIVIEVIKLNPSLLIGKEIMLKSTDNDSVKIKDVNLSCTHIFIEKLNSLVWIDINDLEDEILFNQFNSDKPRITVNTILSILEK